MSKKPKYSPLESPYTLRKFSILFFVMSTLPIILLYFFYEYIKKLGIVGGEFVIPMGLIVIGVCLGYWGMRVVLRDLVNVVKVHTEALEELLGVDKVKEIVGGKNEIAVLARTFDEMILHLKANVRKLEMTKKTLHSVLRRVGKGITTINDTDTFLDLIVETIADALNAERSVLMLYDENKKEFSIKSTYGIYLENIPQGILPLGDGSISQVIRDKKPAFITDYKEGDFPKDVQTALFSPPILCAPLVSHDCTFGIIAVSDREESKLSRDELILLSNIADQTAVSIENSKLNDDAEKTYFQTISALALAVEAKDPYSRGHQDRVGTLAVNIGKASNLSEEDCSTLRDAGRLHDIGKIGVLDKTLGKPGKLTEEEMEMMRKHPVIGEGIILPIQSLRNLCDIVRHHHELLDGSGYPDQLKGDEISVLTRILIVADIFDALTTTRPYRDALSKEAAKKIMVEEFAHKLDQEIVKIMLDVVGID